MKKTILLFATCLMFATSFAQQKTVVSEQQNYVRGIAGSKFSDSCAVTIAYDLDDRKISFTYASDRTAKYADIKSLSIALAFVDKESNAPGIYAETIDKDLASVIIYDDHIEIHYRNGNLSNFSALHAPAAPAKNSATKPNTTPKAKTK